MLQEAYAREPNSYITEHEADEYFRSRVPQQTIDMRKRTDTVVWEMKRAKKTE